jgi:hypothetical protein
MHLFSSDLSKRHGQYPPVLFKPSFTEFTISVSGFNVIFMVLSLLPAFSPKIPVQPETAHTTLVL